MAGYSGIDFSTTPPTLALPVVYNAACDFIDRHLENGNSSKLAVIDDNGSYSYAELADGVNRTGNALRATGLATGDRVILLLHDCIAFPAAFWGAMKAGFIPVPLNTLLSANDYAYIIQDSTARCLVISETLLGTLQPVIDQSPTLQHVIVAGDAQERYPTLADLQQQADNKLDAVTTASDAIAFWLYSSGSTGQPKGTMHRHASLMHTAVCYGMGILGITAADKVFSAAKLFFAYGLGNGMSFPFSVGATAVLMAGRPTPETVLQVIRQHKPTLFFGVPSLYAAILAGPDTHFAPAELNLRACISAGEALPEEIGKRCQRVFGVPVLDGIGSTEMLHIFISNRLDDVQYGTSGRPVPGYTVRLLDESGRDVDIDKIGELVVNGPSAAKAYWNQPGKSHQVFRDGWTYTGDKYQRDAQGYFHYCGRTDDMLKVSGQWVSPFEVETTLIQHQDVLEAAVVGDLDEHNLQKPRAWVVLKPGLEPTAERARAIQDFVKAHIAPHKYPRWIDFMDALPKTATGKIQRFKLRK
jgi:4-hydroxybenzoate-CoA ligase/benzoate-CoA ligase